MADVWQTAYPSFASIYQPGGYGGPYSAPGGGNAYLDAPDGKQYLEDNQQAAFQRYLQGLGLGGFDNRSQTANSLFSRVQQGYKQALGDNPYLGFATDDFAHGSPSYLSTVNFGDIMRQLTPGQRGENIPNYAQKSQWLVR
jgi:hypothetical protein